MRRLGIRLQSSGSNIGVPFRQFWVGKTPSYDWWNEGVMRLSMFSTQLESFSTILQKHARFTSNDHSILSADNRLIDLTKKFHDVRVSTLYAGDCVLIPPGWIHAVITIEESFVPEIYLVRDDWTEVIREASKLELGFCLSEGVEVLKTTEYNEILERYQQDFILIKRLSDTVDPERRKALMGLADEKLREIIEELIKSKQKM